ncbi:MAG: aminopeptidase, partial [Pseudomonadales bacterium]|nr:aminopeptidase [Pseudomonadales bacterium]
MSSLNPRKKTRTLSRPKRIATYINSLMGIVLLLMLSACSELTYYFQATQGQLGLLAAREPIDELVTPESTTSAAVKNRLQFIQGVRTFAETALVLPVGDAYADYVEVGAPYVIWNVSAADEFSLDGKQWCYPIVGCQTYRGYFNQQDAEQYGEILRKEGLDVWVGGVEAYSTLGWFDDPVLSTFLKRDNTSLAALLFHELAHRVVYIAGDTAFNESFATAVELAAIQIWL